MMLLWVLRDVLVENGGLRCDLGLATPISMIQLCDEEGDESALHFYAYNCLAWQTAHNGRRCAVAETCMPLPIGRGQHHHHRISIPACPFA